MSFCSHKRLVFCVLQGRVSIFKWGIFSSRTRMFTQAKYSVTEGFLFIEPLINESLCVYVECCCFSSPTRTIWMVFSRFVTHQPSTHIVSISPARAFLPQEVLCQPTCTETMLAFGDNIYCKKR